MGTINYGTSDYITLGFKPNETWDFSEKDRQEMAEEYGHDIDDDFLRDLCYDYDHDDYVNAKAILDKYCFWFVHVAIKGGYYAGSYLDIESNYDVCFNDYHEKREAQKEITMFKAMLKELAGIGMKSCHPGWSTSYDDHNETLKQIDSVIKQMREDARTTPTYLWYERNQHAKTF